jgi:hypothetical protein
MTPSFHPRLEKITPFTYTPKNFFLTRFFINGCAIDFSLLWFFLVLFMGYNTKKYMISVQLGTRQIKNHHLPIRAESMCNILKIRAGAMQTK